VLDLATVLCYNPDDKHEAGAARDPRQASPGAKGTHGRARHAATKNNQPLIGSEAMFTSTRTPQVIVICLVLCVAPLIFGCGGKSIDWESRIGSYTLQQAIQDYGEPSGKQELADGTVLYAWYDSGVNRWYDVLALVFAENVL
jgi:hypothetical protein